jgi:small subunit ribosomal protein S20
VRALRNRSIKSAVKTKITKFRRAIGEGADGLEELAVTAVAALDRATAKGVLHRNNAARRKARLMKRLNASEAGAAPAAAPSKGSGKSSGRASAAKAPAKRSRSKAATGR